MTDSFHFTCPRCSKKLRGPTSLRGKQVSCPKCKAKLKLPAADRNVASRSAPCPPGSTSSTSSSLQAAPARPTPAMPTASDLPAAPNLPSQPPQAKAPIAHATQSAPPDARGLDAAGLDARGLEDLGFEEFDSPTSTDARAADAASDDFFGMEIPSAADLDNVQATSPFLKPLAGTPASAFAAAPKPKVDLSDAIEKQLDGKIRKSGVSLGYRLGLLITSVFMLMLPLAYLTLIGLFGYGIYHYTTNVVPSILENRIRGGRVIILMFLVGITPIVMGITAIIFLIKPVFVSVITPGAERQRSLRRESEPQLFALVDRICEVIGAPKPSRIDVDTDVNASASFGSGIKSLFSNDLVLTIGVPLIAALNTRQFAGILAHEFGHFSQGASMRATYIIRSINFWFAKMVYQRDALDELLDDAAEDSETAFGLVLMAAQFCVFMTRCVVWVFMMLGHVGSCFLMRQMEYDADRYEVHLSGSRAFTSTTYAMEQLGFAHQATMIGLSQLINRAVMVDDIPRMTELLRNQLTEKQREQIRKGVEDGQTGIFDTHPCSRARIAAAERIESDGMFTLEAPARELLQHYDGLCRNVTQDFYRNAVGRLVSPTEMQPVERHIHGLVG